MIPNLTLIIFLRIVGSIVGALLLYSGLFLYSSEREGLQNRLENWWVRLDEMRDHSSSLLHLSITSSATYATNILDHLFGSISLQSRFIPMSFCMYSLAFFIGFVFFAIFSSSATTIEKASAWMAIIYVPVIMVIIAAILTVDDVFTAPNETPSSDEPAGLIVITLCVPFALYYISVGLSYVVLSWLIAVTTDVVSFAITRKILSLIKLNNNSLIILILIILDIFIVTIFVVAPVHLSHSISSEYISRLSMAVAIANITNIIPSVCYFSFIFLILSHLLVWSTVLRPLYLLIDVRLFNNRKSLTIIGISLITTSNGHLPKTLIGLLKTIELLKLN